MKRLLSLLVPGLLLSTLAFAQVTPGSPVAPGTVGNCAEYVATRALGDSGSPCGGGSGTPGGSSGQIQYNNSGAFGGITPGTGITADLNLTEVTADHSSGDYTILTGDAVKRLLIGAHTYTLAQAGSVGFTAGWGACLINVGSGNATLNTTTSVFKGAGGATSLILAVGDWACPASDGTNWQTSFGHYNSIAGSLYLAGTLTPTALSGNVNDYNPTGLSTALALRIDGGASDRNITGLAGGADGRIITITNIGSTNKLTLVNNSGSSSAGNKFLLSGDTDLPVNTSIALRFDGTSNAWRPWSRALSNTGVTAGSYTNTNLTVGADGRITAASSGSAGSGLSVLRWGSGSSPNASATRWIGFGSLGIQTTEAATQSPVGVACTAKSIYVQLAAAVTSAGAGQYAFDLRKNAGSVGSTCTIGVGASSCAVASGSFTTVSFAATDLVDIQITPSNTPTNTPLVTGVAVECD